LSQLPARLVMVALLSLCSCAGTTRPPTSTGPSSQAPSSKRLALPAPADLCASPQQQSVRAWVRRAQAAQTRRGKQAPRTKLPGRNEGLVPCKHGRVRFLRFAVSAQKVLMLVEEDARPSYLSGGSAFCSFAVLDDQLVEDVQSLWRRVGSSKTLPVATIARLLVASLMFQRRPNMVLSPEQRATVVRRWPATKAAFALAQPGLTQQGQHRFILQAWTTSSYHERGVSCRYLTGFRLSYDRKQGFASVRNHRYAAGSRLARPCGKPLPK
jgi:hypothetical protein